MNEFVIKNGYIARDSSTQSGSLLVTGAVTASAFSGSFSGSFQGDGSQLTGIPTGISIGQNISGSVTGSILFVSASGALGQDNTNFFWNNTDKRLILGTEAVASTNSRLVVIGRNPSGTGTTFAVHNSTGTNNALVVRDDTRVGIATATPASTLQIGTIHNFSLTGSSGSAIFGTRLDQNSNTIWSLDNRTSGANSEVLIFLRSTDEGTTLSHTSPLYTNNYNGSEGRAGVLYTKLQNANAGKQKFAISNTSSASTNKFEWISAVAATGTLSNGFSTTAPIMTLVGNGNLLLGTTSQGASATKTLVINNGTTPTGNVTDSFQQYSADIVAGNAAPHFRTENGNVIKIYQETTGIAAAAFVANTSLIANDTATFGGYTIGQVVAALKAQGLLA